MLVICARVVATFFHGSGLCDPALTLDCHLVVLGSGGCRCHLVRRGRGGVLAVLRVLLVLNLVDDSRAGAHLNDALGLTAKHGCRSTTLRACNLGGHIDVAGRRHHRRLVNLLGCLHRRLYHFAGRAVLHLSDGETNQKLGVVLIVLLQLSIEFIVLRVIKQRDPLLVLLILHDLIVQKVLLQGH